MGAHADAPLHYHHDGAAIDAVSLDPYIGACDLIHVLAQSGVVRADDIQAALQDAPAPRILIRTYARFPNSWSDDFASIDAGAVDWLANHGVRLIGVDTPSLDPANSKTMEAHHAVYRHDMRILEGLCLDQVEPGRYELIALPLNLAGLDAAPVRAILRAI